MSSSATAPADGAILPGLKSLCRFAVQQRLTAPMLLVLLELLPEDEAPKRLHERDVLRIVGRYTWTLSDAWELMHKLSRKGLVEHHHDPRGDAQESITLTSNGELMLMSLFGSIMLGLEAP